MTVHKAHTEIHLDVHIDRWRVTLLGWHCITFYRWTYGKAEAPSVNWWVYLGENLGFGIHFPRSFPKQP